MLNVDASFLVSAMSATNVSMIRDMQNIASGNRLSRAGNDAAASAIYEGLTSQNKGTSQALANIGDGLSMLDTADAALGVVQEDLQRVRELTVQAENGTLSDTERDAIQQEINARVENINNIAGQSSFNGVDLLQPANDITIQSGAEDGATTTVIEAADVANNTGINIDVDVTTGGSLGAGSTFALSDLNVGGTMASANGNTVKTADALSGLDQMIDNVSRMRSEVGASANSLEGLADYNDSYNTSIQASMSQIGDTDMASAATSLAQNSLAFQAQVRAFGLYNQSQQSVLNLFPGG
ncbi:MAG: hypothetical protein HRT47_08160 [Candidatus Caenarcaniphilales bacterium]|nr:hypothetical protein [Candidatus Caenarcaniphilales bacterium]